MWYVICFYSFFFGCNGLLCLCYKFVHSQWVGLCEIFIWIFINIGIFYYFAPEENAFDEIRKSYMDIALTFEQPTFIGNLNENNWKFSLESLNFNNLITIILFLLVFIRQSIDPSQKILISHFLIFLDTSFANYYIDSNTWEINLSKIIFSIFMMVFTYIYFLTNNGISVKNNENKIIICFILNTAWLIFTVFTHSYRFLSTEAYEWLIPAAKKILEEIMMNFVSLPFLLCFACITKSILDALEMNSYIPVPKVFWPKKFLRILMDDIGRILGLVFVCFLMLGIHWGLEIIYFCPKILTEGFIMIFSEILSYFLYNRNRPISGELDNNLVAFYLEISAFRWILSFVS
ncbi:unnamed protein product [Blepharisma stoltei]|uniref:Transmembrane protein n=1 Tax=Blepharisma stoltei TaxID=1481888 RepID=A0AAU9IR01_9CILI|nr:unnamed protein product [Blepharisma stoltei]